MNELIKIRDVSVKYDISARTLRYYEDMGLITSTRVDDYAYRLYDDASVKRLEQILILRKLNISIKDIQRIFNTPGSEVVLEVLEKKVDDIDEEVSLLHELKGIVLEFIRQIEQADFGKESDVKLLYDKAREIETQLVNVDYEGNTADVNRLLQVTKKLDDLRHMKLGGVRIFKIPKFKAMCSGFDTGENVFGKFGPFQRGLQELKPNVIKFSPPYDAPDLAMFEGDKVNWFWAVEDWVTEADVVPYHLTEFEGGIYAVGVADENEPADCGEVYNHIVKWINHNGSFELDDHPGHRVMCHRIGCDEIQKALGMAQQEIFVPIKIKGEG